MAIGDLNGELQLKTNKNEFVKQFCVYDLTFRMTDLYEAQSDAINGTPCSHTQIEYDGASTRILKTKESVGTWDSTWDI